MNQSGATERSQFRKWCPHLDYQIHDAIVVLVISISRIHTKSMFFWHRIEDQRSIKFPKFREIL